MYLIESNQSTPIKLSDAYLDMKVFDSQMSAYEAVLESGFKLPKRIPGSFEYMQSTFLPNIDTWMHPAYNGFRVQALQCINQEKNFVVSAIDEPPSVYQVSTTCGDPVVDYDYLKVGDAIPLTPSEVFSTDKLKEIIIEKGPVVLKVNNTASPSGYPLQKFKNYSTTILPYVNYHAFTLVGWENGAHDTTKWEMKDSWPTAAPSKMMSNTVFMDLFSTGILEMYRVENICKNDARPFSTPFVVDKELQCQEAEEEMIELYTLGVNLHYIWIAGRMYSQFFIHSNAPADQWEWIVDTPAYTTSEVHQSMFTSILVSPNNVSNMATIRVRARKGNTWTPWKNRTNYLGW
ncbi:MAG: hypothetical protein AB3N16_07630 [Flavobacteriaceae bacterium]